MRVTPRWVPWARASLAFAFVGHAIANVLFDEREFLAAGVRYGWRASEPLLAQGLVVLAVIATIGPLARRSLAPRPEPARRRLLTTLALSQVGMFLLLETSERLIQDEPFTSGIFSSLFVPELLFALASALVLAVLASLAVRIVRSIRRGHRPAPVDTPVPLPTRARPRRPAFTLALGERAPPLPLG